MGFRVSVYTDDRLMRDNEMSKDFSIAACHSNAGFIPKGMNPVDWIRSKRQCRLESKEQVNCAIRLSQKYKK